MLIDALSNLDVSGELSASRKLSRDGVLGSDLTVNEFVML